MFRRILAALDGSPLAEAVLPYATELARAFQAEMLLVRVLETRETSGEHPIDGVDWGIERARAEAYLLRLEEELGPTVPGVSGTLTQGNAARRILEVATERRADLIVLGTHGQGGRSPFPVSGTAHKLISKAGCSVLLVPPADPGAPPRDVHFRRILVPVDCSARSGWALCLAANLASHQGGGELIIGHVVAVPDMPQRSGFPLEEEALELRQRVIERNRATAEAYVGEMASRLSGRGFALSTCVRESARVSPTLAEMARECEADLILLAAHGEGCNSSGLHPNVHGHVATDLMSHLGVPVMVLQDGAVTAESKDCGENASAGLAGRAGLAELAAKAATHSLLRG